jgi:hypothetical protein
MNTRRRFRLDLLGEGSESESKTGAKPTFLTLRLRSGSLDVAGEPFNLIFMFNRN